ncbi:extracellular solute-binding protein [bacterium 1xD42-87]|jgi:raffinose/stachyose/melibiose transport system substrate-binding protein|nr:extracellular solute-binding protein [bacterium 1xD42-87]
MKKKVLSVLLSTAMITSLLVGCGGGGSQSAPAADGGSTEAPAEDSGSAQTEAPAADSASSGEVEEITWMFWDDLNATEDLISIGYKDTVERFNKDYEGKYHVNVVTTNLEEYYAKLNALVAAGETPDCFIVSPGPNLDVYVEPGVAADLTSYVKADGWIDSFNGGEGAFSQQTYDGKIYAVPLNIAAACVFYNTEMFETAGITTMPTDWQGMLDACEKLQGAGYTPLTISAGTAWCLSMLAGYLCDSEGVDLAAIDSGSASWLDPEVVSATNKLVEISKYFQPTAAGDTNDVATANFYNEEAAMLIQGSWAIAQINGSNPDFESKCGVFAFPGTDGRVIAKSDSLAMSATTTHPDAVIAFMKYFTDDTAQKYTAEVGGKIPVTTVEYDASKAPAQLAYVMDVFGNAKSTFGFYNESMATTEAGAFFDDTMVSIYLGTPVEDGLASLEDFYKNNVWNK